MWSLGVIFFELLIGKAPFWASNLSEFKNKIKKGFYSFSVEESISTSALGVMTMLL